MWVQHRWKAEEGAVVMRGCELPCGCWEPEHGMLGNWNLGCREQEQPVLLDTELYLRPQRFSLKWHRLPFSQHLRICPRSPFWCVWMGDLGGKQESAHLSWGALKIITVEEVVCSWSWLHCEELGINTGMSLSFSNDSWGGELNHHPLPVWRPITKRFEKQCLRQPHRHFFSWSLPLDLFN